MSLAYEELSGSLPVYVSLSLPVGEVDLGQRDWRRSHSDAWCGRLHLAHRCAYLFKVALAAPWLIKQAADLSGMSPDCPSSGVWLPVMVVSEILWAESAVMK